MQTSARYKAILEIITEVFTQLRPADSIINEYLRGRKYIGSGDRRFITEHSWNIIRNFRKLEFDAGSSDLHHVFIAYLKDENLSEIFDGSKYGLEALSDDEREILKRAQDDTNKVYPPDVEAETPKWLFDKINVSDLCKSLNRQATADFRLNVKNRDFMIEGLKVEGFDFQPTPYSPFGIRSQQRVNINNCIAYQDGEIEVQDEASQIACILCDIKTNDKIMDYCCGAGGKALTLSYILQGKGKIYVHDINWSRLEAIKDRAERLNVRNIEIIKEVVDKDYDVFVTDVPCSGSGTWRRSPDAKYRFSPNRLAELNKTQREILGNAYQHVKKGGRIVYMTCSVLRDENEGVIEGFLKVHNDIKVLNIRKIWDTKIDQPYPHNDDFSLRLSPLTTNTDGFFVAILEKI